MWTQACLSEIYFNITVMEFPLLWPLTAVLAKALPWHSIHCLALLNCHSLPWGRLPQHETARLRKEYGKSHHYWPLCLTFAGRLIIHYSWVSACWSQASYCCLNQISISTSCDSGPLLNFGLFLYPHCEPPRVCFQITPVIYSVRWDQQTRWPDGLSCPSYSNPLP